MATQLLDEYQALLAAQGLAVEAGLATGELSRITPANSALLVIDMQHDFLPGGSFGVAEGDATIAPIVQLIQQFQAAGSTVIATRDYHPVDHCSFSSHGGPFPPHCIQGTEGSRLHPAIAEALQPAVAAKKSHVVFKGFANGIDSFGALPYSAKHAQERVSSDKERCKHCDVSWTGSFSLFSSNMAKDCNAPPDVLSILDRVPVAELLPADKTLYVVGLALDFCVLDTAINALQAGRTAPVVVILDAARAAHIPGVGAHGSGFLTDPVVFVTKSAGIRFARL